MLTSRGCLTPSHVASAPRLLRGFTHAAQSVLLGKILSRQRQMHVYTPTNFSVTPDWVYMKPNTDYGCTRGTDPTPLNDKQENIFHGGHEGSLYTIRTPLQRRLLRPLKPWGSMPTCGERTQTPSQRARYSCSRYERARTRRNDVHARTHTQCKSSADPSTSAHGHTRPVLETSCYGRSSTARLFASTRQCTRHGGNLVCRLTLRSGSRKQHAVLLVHPGSSSAHPWCCLCVPLPALLHWPQSGHSASLPLCFAHHLFSLHWPERRTPKLKWTCCCSCCVRTKFPWRLEVSPASSTRRTSTRRKRRICLPSLPLLRCTFSLTSLYAAGQTSSVDLNKTHPPYLFFLPDPSSIRTDHRADTLRLFVIVSNANANRESTSRS